MKQLITCLMILMIGLSVFGCKRTVTECSDILKEAVLVRDLVYVPAVHGSGTGPTVGITGGGDLSVGMAFTNISTKEEFAIVFECQHGGFIIKREDLWKKLHEKSSYTCLYREICQTTYDGNQLLQRTLVDYDFLGLEEFPDLIRDDWQKRKR